jgi:hypothetical protein
MQYGFSIQPVPMRAIDQKADSTTPPSTRNAAPLVADDASEET